MAACVVKTERDMAEGHAEYPCCRKLWNGYSVCVRVMPLVAQVSRSQRAEAQNRTELLCRSFKLPVTKSIGQGNVTPLAGEAMSLIQIRY